MFLLAHLSDPHLQTPPGSPFSAFANKRLLGFLSWRLSRRKIHCPHVLDAMIDDLRRVGPDHIAVTGDLVNVSLPAEFSAAAGWLRSLGPPTDVTVVPGNHDTYVSVPWNRSLADWAAYMAADDADATGAAGPAGFDDFPFVRRRGPAALVGLTTAIPSPPGMAYGELGHRQLDRLDRVLQELGAEGLFRIVLLHHPPLDASTAPRKRLLDAAAFRQVIATAGAELVLHGHNHRFEQGGIASDSNTVPVFGVPSASAVSGEADRIGRYHVYRITRDGDGWAMTIEARLFDAAANRFTPVSLPPVHLRCDRGTFALPPNRPPAVATA